MSDPLTEHVTYLQNEIKELENQIAHNNELIEKYRNINANYHMDKINNRHQQNDQCRDKIIDLRKFLMQYEMWKIDRQAKSSLSNASGSGIQ